jgi:hypothetical protein
MKYDSYDVSFSNFLKSRMDDMIIENKIRINTTPEDFTKRTKGPLGEVFGGIWFKAFSTCGYSFNTFTYYIYLLVTYTKVFTPSDFAFIIFYLSLEIVIRIH